MKKFFKESTTRFLIFSFVLTNLIFLFIPNPYPVLAAIEERRPTNYTDIIVATNPADAYDSNNTTPASFEYDSDFDPAITFHTWQTTAETYSALVLKVLYSADAASDDTYAYYYSTNGGTGWIELVAPTSAAATDVTAQATLSASQNLSQLQVKIVTNKVRGPDNAVLYTKEIWTEGTYSVGALTVTTPTAVTFGAANYSFIGQNNTGNTFGTDLEPVRVEDSTGIGAGWTVIATCQDWTGPATMDYNGDGSNTGQLTINQDSVTVTKVSGQDIDPAGGPKKGSTTSFSGAVTEITIGSADSSYGQGTYDFKNYNLEQFIPGLQKSGEYSTTITVTVS